MVLTENLYLIFGSDKPLNLTELKRRYRHISKALHPDVDLKRSNFITSYFVGITSAYNLLTNKEFKKIYDEILVNQKDNIEFLTISELSNIDLIGCTFISDSSKVNIGVYELSKSFNEKKLKLIVFYLLNISPKYTLRFVKKIRSITACQFFNVYLDLLFEILMNHEDYFLRYLDYFQTLNKENEIDCILKLGRDFAENKIDRKELKKNVNINDSKLLHLLSIKLQ